MIPDFEEANIGDDIRIIVRALDQVGNKMRYLSETVDINLSGPAILFGPNTVPLRAGSTGFWIRIIGSGVINISIKHIRFLQKEISIEVS